MSAQNGFGVIVSMDDLQEKLQSISCGPRQWMAKLVRVAPGQERVTPVYAEVWFSNPTSADMPTEICWRFPVLQNCVWRETESFVCLHPSLAIPVQEGLYLDGDRLLGDPLEDFFSFWPPLREALS
jgi:hypothetical protein